MPNTYARGILFGKMTLELCDTSSINNDTTDYHCDVDFKAKVRTLIVVMEDADPRAGSLEATT